jgi:hypothetical protein
LAKKLAASARPPPIASFCAVVAVVAAKATSSASEESDSTRTATAARRPGPPAGNCDSSAETCGLTVPTNCPLLVNDPACAAAAHASNTTSMPTKYLAMIASRPIRTAWMMARAQYR